ncbi:hypothetical protein Poli38472_012361 [Pythium oligandrum]|uniref:Uncharacterized protein n=1 Tax=Pythium oligandrum TaxID=41045 RepID=A0A8K1FKL4_PYTOL|nr:hypothetical protein Poli38472_012361 [Pythium oligandrum]|eukprot:TMW67245.1 hypothetical protein Poli38472_012361 [Pythium oligandrum]
MATKAFRSVPTAPRGEKALRKKEEDETKPTVPLKKPRATYYARKDEVSTLKEEVRCLLNRLQKLEATQHASKAVAAPVSIDQESMLRHAALSTSVNQNELLLAGAKSLLLSRVENPLKTHIHLTSDREQRRNALIALRPQRLRDAAEFVRERVRFLDVCRPHRQTEVSETSEGDFVHSICEVVPFNGISTSVPHVYNQLLAFMTHREFNIVEYSDVTTIL